MHLQRNPEHKPRYNIKAARAILNDEALIAPLPQYQEFTQSPYADFQAWPEWYLEDFSPWDKDSTAAQYILNTRGIREETANHFQLRHDNHRGMVGAPFRTASGLLAGMRGRRIETLIPHRSLLKHYDYQWNKVRNTALTWFNEPAFNLPGALVVVEGQFDLMRLWPHWKRVVAILSSKTTPYKMRKLDDASADGIVFLFDNPHMDATAGKRYPEWIEHAEKKGWKHASIDYPKEAKWKDPGEAPEDWLKELAVDLTNFSS